MKTKALISFAVIAKLICGFVFAYAKSRFSQDAAHMMCILSHTGIVFERVLGPEWRGAWWLSHSGRASLWSKRWGFETYRRRVVYLSKTLYSPKVLVIPRNRWLLPYMTKKLLTKLRLNTNKDLNGGKRSVTQQ